MAKMRIYIPSRGRYADRFLDSHHTPLRWLTDTLAPRTSYVVRSDEFKKYRRALKGTGVEVLDCGMAPNLGAKREFIKDYAADHGEKKFLMCDDDVMLFVRKSSKVTNLRMPKPAEVDELFATIEELLDKYAMVGVSAREGNNRVDPGKHPVVRECTRAIRMYGFRTKEYRAIDANRLKEMADIDTTLQLLQAGHKNAVIYSWAQSQPGYHKDGGLALYRTPDSHDAVCKQLAAMYPGIVTLRQKVRTFATKKQTRESTQWGFGSRTEVTVRWQDAYVSSKRAASSVLKGY